MQDQKQKRCRSIPGGLADPSSGYGRLEHQTPHQFGDDRGVTLARRRVWSKLLSFDSGVWRSPVARLLWEQEVPGSNPGAPIVKRRSPVNLMAGGASGAGDRGTAGLGRGRDPIYTCDSFVASVFSASSMRSHRLNGLNSVGIPSGGVSSYQRSSG